MAIRPIGYAHFCKKFQKTHGLLEKVLISMTQIIFVKLFGIAEVDFWYQNNRLMNDSLKMS